MHALLQAATVASWFSMAGQLLQEKPCTVRGPEHIAGLALYCRDVPRA